MMEGAFFMSQSEIMLENRQNVIAQAIALFKKNGVEHTTIYDLAHVCHLTPRSIFRYFGSKDKLMAEAAACFWEEIYHDIDKAYKEIASSEEVSGYQQLAEMLSALPKAYKKIKISIMLLQEMELYLFKHKVLSTEFKPFESGTETFRAPIREALEKGKKDGSMRKDMDVFRTHNLIINTLVGVMEKQAYVDLDDKMKTKLNAEKQLKDACDMILLFVKA